jgi:hypothetical protein
MRPVVNILDGGHGGRPLVQAGHVSRAQFADDLTPGLKVSPTRHGNCGMRIIIIFFRDTR